MLVIGRPGDRVSSRSGAYMGGVGAGGFEPRPDGRFYRNMVWDEWQSEQELDAVFVHMDAKGNKRMLRLDDFAYTHGAVKGVDKVVYRGEFPKVSMEFPETGVKIDYTSIFIPGDAKNSSLPAVLVRVRGKGKLSFLMASRKPGVPRLEKKAAFIEGKWGGVGVYSAKARPLAIETLHRGWSITFLDKWHSKDPFPLKNNKPGDYEIGLHWEGGFDDEFVMCWHNPDLRERYGKFLGHYYQNYFPNVRQVMKYVLANRKALKGKSEAFHKSIYGAKVPPYLKDAYSAQFACLAKQSWFAKNGNFGVWEGSCDCCGLQTTDVAYYGSWLYSRVQPFMERMGISLTARFQNRKDGWIPHCFYGTFHAIDEYRRKDMNSQFTMMVLRDYLQWKDRGFLKRIYPNVKAAVEGAWKWDTNGDGLPEVEGTAQTFDSWGFSGTSSYIAGLWLATLKGAAILARDMGDMEFAEKCRAAFAPAQATMVKKLWNGKWFAIASDGKKRDDCCLLDALSGDWVMRALGLGGVLPDSLVRSHLKSCLKLNRKKYDGSYMKQYGTPGERGWCYINGGYATDKRIGWQQYEPWTGIEYAFAVHLQVMGMKKEAMRVVKDVHDRRASCGTVWNHQECGGDYYRAMMVGAFWELVAGTLPPGNRG